MSKVLQCPERDCDTTEPDLGRLADHLFARHGKIEREIDRALERAEEVPARSGW